MTFIDCKWYSRAIFRTASLPWIKYFPMSHRIYGLQSTQRLAGFVSIGVVLDSFRGFIISIYPYAPGLFRYHDDVIKWKHFPRYWPFVRGIHRPPVNSPHKGQWRGALMFFFYLRLNKRLRKQSWGWWFETLSHPLWRHCNDHWDSCKRCSLIKSFKGIAYAVENYDDIVKYMAILRRTEMAK